MGLVKPLGLLVFVALLLLAEPDFGAATVLFATGFGMLFLAGARLRYVLLRCAARRRPRLGAAGGDVAVPHGAPHRVPRSRGRIRTTAASSSRSR